MKTPEMQVTVLKLIYTHIHYRAKKVVSHSQGLVDFPIRLVESGSFFWGAGGGGWGIQLTEVLYDKLS